MTSNATNPALRAAATGLGDVVTGQVIDIREYALSPADFQVSFICRRTRLRPETARVIASLAFGSAA